MIPAFPQRCHLSKSTTLPNSPLAVQQLEQVHPINSHAASAMVCCQCKKDPCSLEIGRRMIEDTASSYVWVMQPSASRHYFYRAFTQTEYGYLGARNCIVIPVYVRDYIRSLFPDEDDKYTVHRDADLGEILSGLSSNNYYLFSVM